MYEKNLSNDHHHLRPSKTHIQGKSVFLAGSIENGKAENWQQYIINKLTAAQAPVTILNPRRPNWDSTWKAEKSNPQFYEQVTWELEAQERADLIVMYFAPGTKSPISLLELGLFCRAKKMVVCCPNGFWRKGNVDIVCERYNVPTVASLEGLVKTVLAFFTQNIK